MHPTEIPPKLIANVPQDDIEVPVAVPDLTTHIKDVAAAAKDLNMTEINTNVLARMRQAGVALESLGMMKISRAGLFLTQQGLLNVNSQMMTAVARAENDGDRIKLALCVGYLAEKLMRVSKEIREGQEAVESNKPQTGRYKSFAPGQIVQINVSDKPATVTGMILPEGKIPG